MEVFYPSLLSVSLNIGLRDIYGIRKQVGSDWK
jgi:hypothetical protein